MKPNNPKMVRVETFKNTNGLSTVDAHQRVYSDRGGFKRVITRIVDYGTFVVAPAKIDGKVPPNVTSGLGEISRDRKIEWLDPPAVYVIKFVFDVKQKK